MPKGVASVLISFVYWGLVPLYWKQLTHVDAFELLVYRAVGVFLTVLIIVTAMGNLAKTIKTHRSWATLRYQFAAASFIAINWFTFVWAIINNQILDTSLGYFLSPFMGLLLGRIFGNERISIGQEC